MSARLVGADDQGSGVVLPGDASGHAVEASSALAQDPPLSFGFIAEVPGELIAVGRSRLHLHCRGEPDRGTVVFEAGLGGNALEWQPVRDRLHRRMSGPADRQLRTCSYDRAGYAWSDPVAGPRDARRSARDLDTLLRRAGIDGPLVLVAHSFGGFVARLFAGLRSGDIAGMVLVDTSHEQQFERLASVGVRRMLPGSGQFVLSRPTAPENLPFELKRKVEAFQRMRKTYAATHGEMSRFAVSADQVHESRTTRAQPWRMPLVVVRRGRRLYTDDDSGRAKDAGWAELQEDLAALSTRGRTVVGELSGHHVHVDEPHLVATEIEQVLLETAMLSALEADVDPDPDPDPDHDPDHDHDPDGDIDAETGRAAPVGRDDE